MTMITVRQLRFLSTLALGVTLLFGCYVSAHKDQEGKDKDVDIRTPLGSLSVKKQASNAQETGMQLYPGARPYQGRDEDDGANVNISSSLFGMKLAVARYQTEDSPDRVADFYKKELHKFGDVVDCQGSSMGAHFHRRGSHNGDEKVSCDSDSGGVGNERALKVGTENHQHIVAIKPDGKGSQFTLVYLRAWDNTDAM